MGGWGGGEGMSVCIARHGMAWHSRGVGGSGEL